MPDHRTENYETLLRDAGCSEKVIRHCRAVRDCALDYAGQTPTPIMLLLKQVPCSMISAGAGPIRSAMPRKVRISCAERGFPEAVARIVECHTGAGLTADECTMLGLCPPRLHAADNRREDCHPLPTTYCRPTPRDD